ncbi:hypothetical protein F2Q68_00044489 [Brassica cretica]|uniref:Uncharacterized protein n=1 Tax=Brassica cretica TaxID=69181 RepID=A0A8S9LN64_BRACR|nr:hypothetical protein F2Q68_00044489 [Brassica cretica]
MESSSAKSYYDFASNMLDDAYELINNKALHERLHDKIFFYQSIILSKYIISNHLISPMGIHPDCAFAHLYRIENAYMPEEVLSFFWYLCTIYTICIILDIQWRYQYINAHQGQKDCFSTFLTWLAPLSIWRRKLRKSAKATGLPFKKLKSQGSLNPFFNPQTIYFFHRTVQINNKSGKIHVLPTLIHHNNYQRGVRPDFNINDKKVYEAFILMRSVLTMPDKHFSFFFIPNWTYSPSGYQTSLRLRSSTFMEKQANPPAVPEVPKMVKHEPQSQEYPPEYFQDSRLPDDSMNIDEIRKMFNIEVHDNLKEPEEDYTCPDDHFGCCDKHIIEFEIDH